MESHPTKEIYQSLIASDGKPDINLLAAESPNAWLKANKDRINRVLTRYPRIKENAPPDFLQDALFPRCHLFVISCALYKQVGEGVLDDLRSRHAEWSKLSLTERLASFKAIRTHLCQEGFCDVKCSDYPIKDWAEKLIEVDSCHIGALVLEVMANGKEKTLFFEKKTSLSTDQDLIDLLQALLDFRALQSVHGVFLQALLKLSRQTGIFPQSLCHQAIDEFSPSCVESGGFSDVHKGSLQGQIVAVKVMRSWGRLSDPAVMKKFCQEVVLWSHISHPNILPFYGIYFKPVMEDSHRVCLLSPWMENGNLKRYIKARPHINREPLIRDIVKGLQYLHSFRPTIIHGDLKEDNVLVTPSGRACLADFGLGRLVQDKQWLTSTSTTVLGAQWYLAPELLEPPTLETGQGPIIHKSPQTDVYAFGCLCYEIYTGNRRFSEISSPMKRFAAVLANSPSPKPDVMKDDLWAKLTQCWESAPEKRPHISDFLNLLGEHDKSPGCPQPDRYAWDGSIKPRLRPRPFATSASFGSGPIIGGYLSSAFPEEDEVDAQTQSPPSSPVAENPPTIRRTMRLPKDAPIEIGDVVILVMGGPLSGKSTFTNNFFGNPGLAPVHNQLLPPTHEMAAYYQVDDPLLTGRRLIIFDTPGLFSWQSDDYTIVKETVDLFLRGYGKCLRIVYLHDISAPMMSPDVQMSLAILSALCGKVGYERVWLATTQWGASADTSGPIPEGLVEREAHLKSAHWKECLESGGQYRRIRARYDERALIGDVLQTTAPDGGRSKGLGTPKAQFLIQKEMQEDKIDFPRTEAGVKLKSCLSNVLEEEAKMGGDKQRIDVLMRQYEKLSTDPPVRRRFGVLTRSRVKSVK